MFILKKDGMKTNMELNIAEVSFIKENNKEVTIRVETNIDTKDVLYAALDNWLARTVVYTAESFANYINSKTSMSGHTAKAISTKTSK